jgi:hypothetical protein
MIGKTGETASSRTSWIVPTSGLVALPSYSAQASRDSAPEEQQAAARTHYGPSADSRYLGGTLTQRLEHSLSPFR